MSDESENKRSSNLRLKAEEQLKLRDNLNLSEIDANKLIHEFQVHQIELEMQNEELLAALEKTELAQKLSERTQQKYTELFDFAPIGYMTLTKSGEIIEINLCAAKMLKKERSSIIKSRLGFFIRDDAKLMYNTFLDKVFKCKTEETCELILLNKDNSPIYIHIAGIVTKNGEQCLVNLIDITEQKIAEQTLKESEERFRSYINSTNDAVFILDTKLRFTGTYGGWASHLGLTELFFLGKTMKEIIGENFEIHKQSYERALHGEHAAYESDFVVKKTIISYHTSLSPIFTNNKVTGIIGVGRDISKLKIKEKLQKLNSDILSCLNAPVSFDEAVKSMTEMIKQEMEYDAVGIRFKHQDDFPYLAQQGFSDVFLQSENSLITKKINNEVCRDENGKILLECTCGLVISEKTDPKFPFFTEKGSFYTNHSTEFLGIPKEQESRLNPRNVCIHQGYNSVALIPIRDNKNVMGVLQLNAKKEDCFSIDIIHSFESICEGIGISFMRKKADQDLACIYEELKHSNDLLEGTGEMGKIGGWELDLETSQVTFSKEAALIHEFDFPFETPSISQGEEFFPPDAWPIIQSAVKAAIEHGTDYDLESPFITAKGRRIWVRVQGFAIRENNMTIKLRGTIQDITERKQVDLKMSEQNQELKKLNEDKDRFMQILGHDLKSPFNSLLGFSNLLLKNIHKYDIDKIEYQLKIINQTANQAFNLLEDLILWSKSQSGILTFEPQKIVLSEICTDIICNLSHQSDAKAISINCSETEKTILFADINMFKTILRNLISNAIKFTNEKGQIDIYSEINQTHATIIVSDNGLGIEKENIPKLWDFTKPFSTRGTADEKGTGLGLLLCKEFVEKHGGEIWVESELGKGCDFKFTMPMHSES